MLRNPRIVFLAWAQVGLWLVSTFVASGASAQTVTAPVTLKQAFDSAWVRQPEAQSSEMRREAASARRLTADAWTSEPPTLELSSKSDQILKNYGSREYVAGVALPLWLPGERTLFGSLADAESRAINSRVSAAQLRTAAAIREAWWNWQRSKGMRSVASERLISARKLAEDVSRRVKAGDLARADQHQAEGALATAEAALAEADSSLAAATQHLRSVVGVLPGASASDAPEKAPAVPNDFAALDSAHPAVVELFDRAEVARRAADLASIQRRANPELLIGTTRDRGTFADAYQQTITVGVRIPFGSENRTRAKASLARAEAIETEGFLKLEREKLIADLEAAKVRVVSSQSQLLASEKRARLARETRGFFDKSFRLGESDLPTRLRIELEAVESERQFQLSRIDLAAAISALRQALGLLPENN